MTRDELSRIVDYDPRHLQAIENEGQKPSLELFIQLVTMFGVSVAVSRRYPSDGLISRTVQSLSQI
ncbi:helix-turn-helix domain-containing protein [Allocoprococcus comes]